MGSSVMNAEQKQHSSSPKIETKSGSTPPQTTTPPPSLNTSFNTGNSNAPNRHLLGLTPSDEVLFDINNNTGQGNGLQAKLQIKNISNKAVIFKIKTTSPEKYRVRPSASHIKIGGTCDVEIHVHQSQLNDEVSSENSSSTGSLVVSPEVSASLMKDKFLVTAITLEDDKEDYYSQSKLNELLKNNRPEAQYRLRCSLSGNQHKLATTNRLQGSGVKEISPTSSTLASANKQLENLSKKVTELKQNVADSAETIASLRKTTMIMLGIIMFLQIILTYQMMSLTPGTESPENEDSLSYNSETNSEQKEL